MGLKSLFGLQVWDLNLGKDLVYYVLPNKMHEKKLLKGISWGLKLDMGEILKLIVLQQGNIQGFEFCDS